jgi:hypothetical protein
MGTCADTMAVVGEPWVPAHRGTGMCVRVGGGHGSREIPTQGSHTE